jgi:hypothetical protein
MKNPKAIKYLSIVNLLIIVMLLLDSFVLPPVDVSEELQSSTYLTTRGKSSGYRTLQLEAKSGNKYQFRDDYGIGLDYDSRFHIQRSRVLRLPLVIHFQLNSQYYSATVSMLQTNYLLHGVLLVILGFSLFGLLHNQPSGNAKMNLTVVSLFFYGGMIYLILFQTYTTGVFAK